jgi:IS6 family transposase
MARWQHAPLFRGRHFADDVITLAVRWYSRYSLSFRELEDLLRERHIVVDHTTLWHWVQRYAPELDKRLRSQLRPTGRRWHIDETYVRVGGEWVYLYRAVDETGATVDFLLAQQRSVRQAKWFFRHALATPRATGAERTDRGWESHLSDRDPRLAARREASEYCPLALPRTRK